ncbi:GEVED domain-containing protein [Fibrella arboris]|uniref:GEVED domain-containing protein n=1 Tax=Fibrella arboris TaxID=3242486 RepID=UPI003522672B
MNRLLASANKAFLLSGSGIQFYFAAIRPDYIDNDALYTRFDRSKEDSLGQVRDLPNALNLYIVNAFDQASITGYAYPPTNASSSTRIFIQNLSDKKWLGNRILPHELGHAFGLAHTYQGNVGNSPELVTRGNGANCAITGDLLCDTPADPYGLPGASTTVDIDGCLQYSGVITDAQGFRYAPLVNNIMSYYAACTHAFTEGQYGVIMAGLSLRQTHTAYSLNAPSTGASVPFDLTAIPAPDGSYIQFSWKAYYTNRDMGYFIERSTNPNSGFIPIGATGPEDDLYIIDNTFVPNTTYYYRVRPSNSITDKTSAVVTIKAPGCVPYHSGICGQTNHITGVSVNKVVLSVGTGCGDTGYTYTATPTATIWPRQVMPVSITLANGSYPIYAAVWVDINQNGAFETTELLARTTAAGVGPVDFTISLPSSLPTGQVKMRIVVTLQPTATSCGTYYGGETEDYALTVGTSTTCPTPTGLVATQQGNSAFRLNWSGEPNGTYILNYKPDHTSNWNSINDLSGQTYALTGLAAGQTYEWQVQRVCGPANQSPPSAAALFQMPCLPASDLRTSLLFANSAQLNWSSNGERYNLQWRAATTSNWTDVPNQYTTTYNLTALSPLTAYEWRVATFCPLEGFSAYSAPSSFTTTNRILPTYCRPVSTNGCANAYGLQGLRIGQTVLSSQSGCSSGYQSFTTATTTLIAGQPYGFTVTQFSSTQMNVAVWLDINQNGTFDATERILTLASSTNPIAGTLVVPASTTAGLYAVRIRATPNELPADACAALYFGETEDYVLTVENSCPLPGQLLATETTPTTALLSWEYGNGAVVATNLRYRVVGATDWTLLNGLPGTNYLMIGLLEGRTYECQIQNICGTSSNSPFGSTNSLTTKCPPPTNLNTSAIYANTVKLLWTPIAGNPVTLQWRRADANWSTVSLPTSTSAYSLTGLQGNTAYEWRVATTCTVETSAYTPPVSFTTSTELFYCVPPVRNGCSGNVGIISSFAIGDYGLSYESGCSGSTAYQSFTGLNGGFKPGGTYTFELDRGTIGSSGAGIWLDSDKNGSFELSERLFISSYGDYSGVIRGSITLPNVPEGTYTLRVRTAFLGSPTDPCAAVNSWGETEDYLIEVSNRQCPSPPLSSNIGVSATACRLSWDVANPAQTYKIRWRARGTSVWQESPLLTDTTGWYKNYYTIRGLTNNKSYDWQIASICMGQPVGWSQTQTFQTSCPWASAFLDQITATSFTVYQLNYPEVGYTIDWRVAGSPTWTNSLTTPDNLPVSLTGLTPATTYQVLVTARCADGSSGEPRFPSPNQITTLSLADLSIALSASQRTAKVGEALTFKVRIQNEGPQAVSSAKVTCLLPPNLTYVGSVDYPSVLYNSPTYESGQNTVYINVSNLAPNSIQTYSFKAYPAVSGTYELAAQLTECTASDPDSSPNTGTSDGDDDMAVIDFRTRDAGEYTYRSPNPRPRTLPTVSSNQPLPLLTEADLSLQLATSTLAPSMNTPLTLSAIIANRGGLAATNVVVQVTLPSGWIVADSTGLSINGQVITTTVDKVLIGQQVVLSVPVWAIGNGNQMIQAAILGASQPDTDSPHNNGFGRGEDDEATIYIRMR